MKSLITIICLIICFNFGFSQDKKGKNPKSYNLYIVYDENDDCVFKKPTDIIADNFHFMLYDLKIPNQKDPWFLFNFIDQDSLKLGFTIMGGNDSSYHFNFYYDSRKHREFFIEENKYLENIITANYILSSNLEVFDEILEKANHIYILENTEKEGYKYVAREVSFSEYAGL